MSDVEYRYTATINNGQVMQEYSQATGETVNYQYDELNRLISARNVNTSKWGMEWEYDGFGNRTVQRVVQGSAVPITLTYDAATNRITSPGYVYNARGELTAMPKGAGSQTLAWDWNSRLKQAGSDTAGERYDYSADSRLVYTKEMTTGAEAFTFRLGAQVLGTYTPTLNAYGTITGFTTSSTRRAPFLDGLKQHPGSTDSYFPFGEKKEPPVGSADGFGTYSRREATGLDYADQRWYSSTTGRFLTPDPYLASGGPGRPGSWNRYGYVEGDPVNRVDPTGLDWASVNCAVINGFPVCFGTTSVTVTATADYLDPLSQSYLWQASGSRADYTLNMGGGGHAVGPAYESRSAHYPGYGVALERLTDDCASALGYTSGKAASQALESTPILMQDMGYGSSIKDAGDGAFMYDVSFTAMEFDGHNIIVNTANGLADLSNVWVGTAPNGSQIHVNWLSLFENRLALRSGSVSQATHDAIFYLHELGHKSGAFSWPSDFNNPLLSQANTGYVMRNCFKDLLR